MKAYALPLAAALTAFGCANAPPAPSAQHLETSRPAAGKAPDFASAPPLPLPPRPTAKPEVYSVVVHNVEVQDLLFALARDARINVDIQPGITGTVSMNAIDQTLTEILDRIARQVDMRYELTGKSLSITTDSPFLKTYRIDYPNITRNSQSSISTSTNVASTGGGASGATGASATGSSSNASTTEVRNQSNNRFWETLVTNLKDLLRETDKVLPEGSSETSTEVTAQQNAVAQPGTNPATTGDQGQSSSKRTTTPLPAQLAQQANTVVRRSTFREAASVIANPEGGIVSVRATQRQHEKVREFLERILSNVRRQVLIEATIVEVDLSDRYQQGIDWSLVRNNGTAAGSGFSLKPTGPTSGLATGGLISSLLTATWSQYNMKGGHEVNAVLSLLESFGTLRVLSSPKISVLNSQTSVLKVVDNEVYFVIKVNPATYSNGVLSAPATYETTINTVPIGFLMTVTPQISDNGEIILNLRPTISRITGYASDPNPDLVKNNIRNLVPIVQTREMESILRVQSGDVAILGGLMQDTRDRKSDEVPLINQLPIVGEIFKYKNNASRKSELVIFLRPSVITDASLNGDYREFRSLLPEAKAALTPSSELRFPAVPRP